MKLDANCNVRSSSLSTKVECKISDCFTNQVSFSTFEMLTQETHIITTSMYFPFQTQIMNYH